MTFQRQLDEDLGAKRARQILKDIYTSEYGEDTFNRVLDDFSTQMKRSGRSSKAIQRVLGRLKRKHPAMRDISCKRSKHHMRLIFDLWHCYDVPVGDADCDATQRALHLDKVDVTMRTNKPTHMMIFNVTLTQHAIARLCGRYDTNYDGGHLPDTLHAIRDYALGYVNHLIDTGYNKAPFRKIPMPIHDGFMILEFDTSRPTETTVVTSVECRTFVDEGLLVPRQRSMLEHIQHEGYDALWSYRDAPELTLLGS